MEKVTRQKNQTALLGITFGILAVLPFFLIFNHNVWFDETYTLALIQHHYDDVIRILRSDMHPPLYFVTLKLFCDVFGYSIEVTKIFSILGYEGSLLLGITLIRKYFGTKTSLLYLLVTGAVPMNFYFSVQQRSYSWSFCFVALCFVSALLILKTHQPRFYILLTAGGLLAGYNHIFSLLAVGLIFLFINLYTLIRERKQFWKLLLSDLLMVLGYLYWLMPLLEQTRAAAQNFWQDGADPYSISSFVFGLLVCGVLLLKPQNRNLNIAFAMTCVLGIQVIGLGVTFLYKPLYIARYGAVIMGIFALMVAMGLQSFSKRIQKIVCAVLAIMLTVSYTYAAYLEYNSSARDFLARSREIIAPNDTFLYTDSAFGIVAYYYPDATHLSTQNESWYEAFGNVECVTPEEGLTRTKNRQLWYVKFSDEKLPPYICDHFVFEKLDEFTCDLDSFDLYRLTSR